MRAPKARAKIVGYFAQKNHMTSSFSNSKGGGHTYEDELCRSVHLREHDRAQSIVQTAQRVLGNLAHTKQISIE